MPQATLLETQSAHIKQPCKVTREHSPRSLIKNQLILLSSSVPLSIRHTSSDKRRANIAVSVEAGPRECEDRKRKKSWSRTKFSSFRSKWNWVAQIEKISFTWITRAPKFMQNSPPPNSVFFPEVIIEFGFRRMLSLCIHGTVPRPLEGERNSSTERK